MSRIIDSVRDCKLLHSNPVQSESAAILLRSKLAAIAQRLGFSELKRENMALVVSEMVSNQVKHAGGKGMLQIWQQPGPVLDILSLDYGPGIANLALAEEDGFSSVNTLGKGLGSIRRLSDQVHVYTQQESHGREKRWNGTALLARFCPRGKQDCLDAEKQAALKIGLYSRALSDDRYNGDRIYVREDHETLRWMHLDGLGHGEHAEKATADLAGLLQHYNSPAETLAAVDRQLHNSRGAVAIVGELGMGSRALHILGVGDMHAHVMEQGGMRSYSFAPGVLGKEHKSPEVNTLRFDQRCVAVTASDGIRRNWDTANFPGLFNLHPQLIAYVLGNIMGRISDDQSVCVASIG